MKWLGCGLALLGVLAFVASILVLGGTILDFLSKPNALYNPPRPLMSAGSAPVGGAVDTKMLSADFDANTDHIYHISIQITGESKKLNDDKTVPLYRFPTKYRVLDPQGKVIASGDMDLAWNTPHSRDTGLFLLAAEKHPERIHRRFELTSFKSNSNQQITVEADVSKDSDQATGKAWLVVDHQVPGPKASEEGKTVGGILFVAGPILLLVGIVVFIVGLFTRSSKKEGALGQ